MANWTCRNGHEFEVPSKLAGHVICPQCGSVTVPRGKQVAPKTKSPVLTAKLADSVELDLKAAVNPPESCGFSSTVELPAASGELFTEPVPDARVQPDTGFFDASDVASIAESRIHPNLEPVIEEQTQPITLDVSLNEPGSTVESTNETREVPFSSSYSGVRTTSRMETEISITEPPQLPGYTVTGVLGKGGMGVVYRVEDRTHNRTIALKTLQRISPLGLQQFKQEFRSLADVSHPNLVGLYDLLSDGKTWCFTMEILEAVSFLEYVWSKYEIRNAHRKPVAEAVKGPRLSLAVLHRLYDGLKQLAIGLNALHEAGVLHRDIKPSNVLVTTEGRVVLVDFGLASVIAAPGRASWIQGTPEYMAPEQFLGKAMTPASDWYSVGVMLYEILTGNRPFDGELIPMLVKKQKEDPPEPKALEPSIPPELNELCVALLSRNPSQRPDVVDVLTRIGAGDDAQAIRGRALPQTNHELELVGRESHFNELRRAFDEIAAGATRTLLVQGRSGMGKSVLTQTFLARIRSQNAAVVLTGRCYEQESVPFKALDSLIDSLASYLSNLPAAEVQQAIPEDSLPLVRLFPVLGQIPGATDAGKPSIDNVDQPELRQRAMNALRELLKWLGARQPMILSIDDLQWGDVDSAVLLADLMRPPDAPRVLLLGSFRSENVASSLCLQALAAAYTAGQTHPHMQELIVEALSIDDATRLARLLLQRVGADEDRHAGKIARESGGWPFFVWELVQHVQESPESPDQALELDEVIRTRASCLPEETRRLLELIAVAGRPIVVTEAYQALNVGATGQNLLIQLRTRHFIRTGESEAATTVESYHDRIREAIVNSLDARVKRRYNMDLAETIQQLSGISAEQVWAHLSKTSFEEPTEFFQLERAAWQRVFDLSHYYAAAGEYGRALPFAVIAAEQARRQNALEVAEQQYRVALQGSSAAAPALRFRILEGLGDVLILRGSYSAANEQLQAARGLAQESFVQARIDGKLGRSTFKKGDVEDAVGYLEKALTALGEAPPKGLISLIPRLSKEVMVQGLHTLMPRRLGRRDQRSKQGTMDLIRVRLLDDLTIAYWFSRSMELVLWAHLREMNIAERYPPTQEMGKAYSFHAITMSAIPLAQRGINYAQRAHEISVAAGDLWGQGKARSFHTFSCIVLARFQEGLRTGAEAVRLLEQAGDVWEANMARMIATVPMYHLGDLKSAYHESKKAYEIGLETGDYSAVCIALLFWIPNAPQLIPRGAIQKELKRKREDPLSIAGAVYARGLELLLCEDNPLEAAQVLQDCLDRAKKRGLRNVCIFSAVSWKATALRIVAERAAEGVARQAAIRVAKSACRAALKITKSYLACRPHALREMGIVAALDGNESQARYYFDESKRIAGQHEARYELAKTNLSMGEAGLKFGWPASAELVTQSRAMVKELEQIPSAREQET